MENDPGYILAIDTATPCSTVAITSGTLGGSGTVVAEVALSSSITHSRRLLSAIDWLFSEAGLDKGALAGYCIGLGPGSFTGLRIGMATVKGLASAAGLPLYGISTLDGIAAGCSLGTLPLRVVLDARKKEVYTAAYRFDGEGIARRDSAIEAMPPMKLTERITAPTLFVGDGLKAYRSMLQERLGERMVTAPVSLWSPSAAVLGLLAGEMAARGERLGLGMATPLYVRASDAELNLKTRS